MKKAYLILALALALVPARPAAAIEGVGATFAANDFYRLCRQLEPRGLPTTDQMKRFAPLFTRELNGMIENARRHRSKLLRENPAAPQPWLWHQGTLFASLTQGFTYYFLGMPVIMHDTATIPVHLEYHHRGKIVRWIDIIILERSGRHWLVDDVFLNAPWPLTSGASLRSRLGLPIYEARPPGQEVKPPANEAKPPAQETRPPDFEAKASPGPMEFAAATPVPRLAR